MKPLHFLSLLFGVLLPISCSDSSKTDSLVITGSSTVAPVVADAAKRYEESHPNTRIDVQTGGSSRGIADTGSGLAGIGMASRDLKGGETELTAHRIGVDGVCLIVHRDNPVAGLSKEQVIDIYQKKITNWKEIGGNDTSIVVANKADGTGTLEVFLGYTGLDAADVKADVIVGGNQQAIKAVAGDPNAIAYVSIGAASSEASAGTPLKLLDSDGVEATTANVANGSFPITRPLNLITRGEVTGLQKNFLEYLQSDSIRDIIENYLYVSVAP